MCPRCILAARSLPSHVRRRSLGERRAAVRCPSAAAAMGPSATPTPHRRRPGGSCSAAAAIGPLRAARTPSWRELHCCWWWVGAGAAGAAGGAVLLLLVVLLPALLLLLLLLLCCRYCRPTISDVHCPPLLPVLSPFCDPPTRSLPRGKTGRQIVRQSEGGRMVHGNAAAAPVSCQRTTRHRLQRTPATSALRSRNS